MHGANFTAGPFTEQAGSFRALIRFRHPMNNSMKVALHISLQRLWTFPALRLITISRQLSAKFIFLAKSVFGGLP
jgi:hypothetical protein